MRPPVSVAAFFTTKVPTLTPAGDEAGEPVTGDAWPKDVHVVSVQEHCEASPPAGTFSQPGSTPSAVHLGPDHTGDSSGHFLISLLSTALCLSQGLCFNGSAFVLYLSAAVVDATSVSPERDSHNFNSWAASSVSDTANPSPPCPFSKAYWGQGAEQSFLQEKNPLAI